MGNEKQHKFSISNIIVTVAAIVILVAAIYFGRQFLPLTGDEIVGKQNNPLLVQSSVEMDEVNINTMTGGKVAKVCVKEGDVVKAGDVIAVMDSDTLLAKKQQAQASIQAAKGQIKAAQATYQKARNGATEEDIAKAKAAYELAEATYNRMQVMLEAEAISQSDFDQAAMQYEVAKQTYLTAEKGARQEDIDAAAAAVDAYQGQLAVAEGALAEVQSYLDETSLIAPIGGTITAVNVSDGELTSTGLPIAVISNSDHPWISCKVMEDQLAAISLQQKVQVTFPAYPDRTFMGTVTNINKNADFAVKRATNASNSFDVVAFSVKVELDPIDNANLYAGMTAFVDFNRDTSTEVVADQQVNAAEGDAN